MTAKLAMALVTAAVRRPGGRGRAGPSGTGDPGAGTRDAGSCSRTCGSPGSRARGDERPCASSPRCSTCCGSRSSPARRSPRRCDRWASRRAGPLAAEWRTAGRRVALGVPLAGRAGRDGAQAARARAGRLHRRHGPLAAATGRRWPGRSPHSPATPGRRSAAMRGSTRRARGRRSSWWWPCCWCRPCCCWWPRRWCPPWRGREGSCCRCRFDADCCRQATVIGIGWLGSPVRAVLLPVRRGGGSARRPGRRSSPTVSHRARAGATIPAKGRNARTIAPAGASRTQSPGRRRQPGGRSPPRETALACGFARRRRSLSAKSSTEVGHCVAEWEPVGYGVAHQATGVAGLLPLRHSGPTLLSTDASWLFEGTTNTRWTRRTG